MNQDVTQAWSGLEIAVIGMAGRFPGARNVDEFWQNLCNGVESLSFFSDQELEAAGIDQVTLSDPAYVKAGAIVEDIEWFDAAFFNIHQREAEMMDPQHRLFLECAWEALEHAGYAPDAYTGAIGLYAGARTSAYLLFNLCSAYGMGLARDFQTSLINDKDFLTTYTSYKLNLRGPSVSVGTACSTSLVAVHLACQALLSGACDLALAGGVAINVPQKSGYLYQEGGIGSPDGHCRAFDAQAQGTVGGNGIGIVVLKRLEEAWADGDQIWAIIKGSATNNDGAVKIGYTAPSVDGQAQVIRDALQMAGVEPDTVTYIETHGTGTPLGDPIEIAALTQAFGATTGKKPFCAIGSVKTNIGHLDAAAGVAGLIKTVLALKHKRLPPSLHFRQPNPKLDLEHSPFYVNTRLSDWKTDGLPCRAGVSSFGIGGTNAHLVLEEPPTPQDPAESRPWQVLTLSARSSLALDVMTEKLANYLKQHPTLCLADVAYTLQVGRRAWDHRRVCVCSDREQAVQALETLNAQSVFSHGQTLENPPIVFMFSGQGAQYVNMGRELYQHESLFRDHVDRCAAELEPYLGLDLRTLLYPPAGQSLEQADHQLQQTRLTQPALFVIEYALAQVWLAWGIRPRAMIGHSIGEYVAACLAGVFSLEDGLALVAARGQLMQDLPGGAMVAVPFSEQEVMPLLSPPLSLAVINAPARCVVAGPTEAVSEFELHLEKKGVAYRRLHTSHAFHSDMMSPILAPFAQRVKQVELHPPQIPYISNVSGGWITPGEATSPDYWARHLRQTVRFADGLRTLAQATQPVFLEIGPGRMLSTLAQHQSDGSTATAFSTIRHPGDHQSDLFFLLKTLGQLWTIGIPIDWPAFYANERRQRTSLPNYPFERKRYWVDPAPVASPPLPRLDTDSEHVATSWDEHYAHLASLLSVPGQAAAASEVMTLDRSASTPILEQIITDQLEIILRQLEVLAADSGSQSN